MVSPLPGDERSILRQRPFMLLFISRITAGVASQMQTTAIGWLVYQLTSSAFDLGIIGLVQFLPLLILTLLVGHLVDAYDRRVILFIARLGATVAALGLAIGGGEGWLGLGGIFGLIVVSGSARAFEGPTVSALLPNLVTPTQLPKAIAVTSSSFQIAQIIGPPLGGLLFVFGPVAAFGVPAVLFALSGLCAILIPRMARVPANRGMSLDSLFSGVRFIRANRAVLGSISLDLFAVLLGGATGLLPIYARDILHVGPQGLGVLNAMPAIGAMLMAAVLARFPVETKVGVKLFIAVTAFGAATIWFALSTTMVMACAALMAVGAADMVSVVVRSLLVQLLTPDAMRGRVNAIDSMFTGTSNQLGAFESGMTAGWFGAVVSVIIGGAGSIAVALLWMKFFPEIRKMDRFEQAPPQA